MFSVQDKKHAQQYLRRLADLMDDPGFASRVEVKTASILRDNFEETELRFFKLEASVVKKDEDVSGVSKETSR